MVGEITGESIKSAIALKIKSGFAITSGSPPITIYPNIYKEKIVQGMEKPCFFIWVMDISQEKLMRNNYMRDIIQMKKTLRLMRPLQILVTSYWINLQPLMFLYS